MKPGTFTLDEVSSLVSTLLGSIRAAGATEDGAYTLEQVSARTGFAVSSLTKDCRAGKLEHVHYGDTRSMTPTQVGKLLARFTRGGDLVKERIEGIVFAEADEMTQARQASQRAANRKSRRGAAA